MIRGIAKDAKFVSMKMISYRMGFYSMIIQSTWKSLAIIRVIMRTIRVVDAAINLISVRTARIIVLLGDIRIPLNTVLKPVVGRNGILWAVYQSIRFTLLDGDYIDSEGIE